MTSVELHPVVGIPAVGAGDDLAALILAALPGSGLDLRDGDLLVVSSKVVAKAQGRLVDAATRERAISRETYRVVAERLTSRGPTQIVRTYSGLVLAAAGVDASNVPDGQVLLLPENADAAAKALLDGLRAGSGVEQLGVVISDTFGRPWRLGQVDTAIGAAGVVVGQDLSGTPDTEGRPMEVTYRALADEIAAAADLVKGKVDGVPVALVRGLSDLIVDPYWGQRADLLQRREADDWFRFGHAEAIRTALGFEPGTPGVPIQPIEPSDVVERLQRAVAVALASPTWPEREGLPDPWVHPLVADEYEVEQMLIAHGEPPSGELLGHGEAAMAMFLLMEGTGPHELVALGALAQRVLVAAWAEDLDAAFVPRFYGPADNIAIRAVPREL